MVCASLIKLIKENHGIHSSMNAITEADQLYRWCEEYDDGGRQVFYGLLRVAPLDHLDRTGQEKCTVCSGTNQFNITFFPKIIKNTTH